MRSCSLILLSLYCFIESIFGAQIITNVSQLERLKPETVCDVVKSLDLCGRTITLPQNCTLIFGRNGSICNGALNGNGSKMQFVKPFIGESMLIRGCMIAGKDIIRDTDVFLTVHHTQQEIQTLFNISGGVKIEFSRGVYENVEKISILNNIQADFNNSTIRLKWDEKHVGECFYMKLSTNRVTDFFRISNLKIVGHLDGIRNDNISRRCIQLFGVSEVEFDNISIDKFNGGRSEFRRDSSDLSDKSRIGTSSIAIMNYDKCIIRNCCTNDVNKEIFWCVPNNNPDNITYFINNKSTYSAKSGSSSFFTLLDGRCVVRNNEVHNYRGSAFNVFCYDSEISYNKFYSGKRSVAIDLSEGTMYRAKNVNIHHNECKNTKGMIAAYGENLTITNNRWVNDIDFPKSKCTIITIKTRGKRVPGSKYIGSSNNPQQDTGSRNVIIENNYCANRAVSGENTIHGASLYGVDIHFSNNIMSRLYNPAVLLADGENFVYQNNQIFDSKNNKYTELYIKRGNNITVANNVFCQNIFSKGVCCTVMALDVEGKLVYRGNKVSTIGNFRSGVYIPCLINEYSKLESAELFVEEGERGVNVKTGLNPKAVRLKTNIK